MQILNLIRKFELQWMKESQTIKEYSNKLLPIVNKVKLMGTTFTYSRIVERYEEWITTSKNIKDLYIQNYSDKTFKCPISLRTTKTYEGRSFCRMSSTNQASRFWKG